jgi:hypothetical protein
MTQHIQDYLKVKTGGLWVRMRDPGAGIVAFICIFLKLLQEGE